MMRTYIHTIRRTLLTLCLMATATLAWADDEPVEVSTVDELKTAIENKGTGTIFKLTKDLALSEPIELNADRNFTLDLAGHEIKATNCRALWIKQGGLTITSSEDNGKITTVGQIDPNSSVIRVGHNETKNGTASLDIQQGVTIETDVCYGVTVFGKNTAGESLTVDGTIKTKINPAVSGNGLFPGTAITIEKHAVITTTNKVAIYHPQSGTLTIKGNATVEGAGGIEMKGGELVVEADAKITATQQSPRHSKNDDDPSTSGYAISIVENGNYDGVSTVNINSQAKITGPVAVVKDSDGAPTPNFTGGIKMLVRVTNGSELVGEYLSPEQAFSEAPGGSTITLLGDCTLSQTIQTNKSYTLDLAGHTMKSDGQRALWIQSGDVTITSTAEGGKITVPSIIDNDQSAIRVGSNANDAVSLKVEQGVTISADECYGITIFGMNETQVLNVAGNVETKIRPAISGHGTKTLKTTDITIAQTAKITTTDNVAIYHPQGGTIKVDGTVTGAGGIEIKGGTLVVGSTAEITATGTPTHVTKNDDPSTSGYAIAIVENNAGYGNGKGVIAVTINSSATIDGIVAKLQDSPVTEYNPTIKDESGNTLDPVAAIGNDVYFTLKDAVDIVPSQGTVKLLADLTLTKTTVMDKEKTYTLDLAGYDLAGYDLTGNGRAAIQVAGGNVTIENSGSAEKKITTNASTAAILLGSNDGNNRNTTLTIGTKVLVDGGSAAGILLQGTATRETLNVQGKVSATGHSAIVTNDEIAKIDIAQGATVTASNAVAIYQTHSGELVVNGTVKGTGATAGAIEMKGGNLTVNSGATITAVGTATHNKKDDAPSTNGYAIAIVENENFPGVGKAYIDKGADITGVIVYLIDSKNNNVAEPMFTGDYTLVAETNIKDNGYGDKYVKLSDAIAADDGEVRLLDDLTENITITSPITLDLGDYTLINNNAEDPAKPSITINTEGTVTLKNGGVISGKAGEPATTMSNSGIVVKKGTVDLQNIGVTTGGVSLTVDGGTVTTDSKSTFTSTGDHTIALGGGTLNVAGKVQNSSAALNNNAIEVDAGSLTVATTATISSENGNGIDWQSSNNLTIAGGKISGTQAVYAIAGKVTINGGTFTGKVDGVQIGNNCTEPKINHGTFICGTGDPINAATATGFVQGDYFSKEIAQNLCANGYKVSDTPKNNGMFYLVDKVVIYDGKDWDFPKDSYTIKTATYERNSGMGTAGTKFGTLCLPFSYTTNDAEKTTIPEGMKFYKVTSINADKNEITITPLTGEIQAGTPVIFQLSQAATKFTIESHNAEIPKVIEESTMEGNNLVGTLGKITLDDSGNSQDKVSKVYYLNSDAFHQASEKVDVPAFRAYIKFSSQSPSSAKVLYIQTEDEEADAISPTPLDDEMEAVYDLNGRKQNGLQRGMNIMKMKNGRTIKVFVNK